MNKHFTMYVFVPFVTNAFFFSLEMITNKNFSFYYFSHN